LHVTLPRSGTLTGRARKVGARHNNQTVAEKRPSDQAFVGIWIDPDYQIVAFLDHVDMPVLSRHFKLHFRILKGKTRSDPPHCGLRKM